MSELSIVIFSCFIGIIIELLIFYRIFRKAGNRTPAKWREDNAEIFRELKAKYFHKGEV